jgi:hypothetical protein
MASQRTIKALKKRHASALLAHPNVFGVGVERDDSGQYVLAVHVTGDADDLPAELEGHPLTYIRGERFEKQ